MLSLSIICIFLASCGGGESSIETERPPLDKQQLRYEFSFEENDQGFTIGVADYSVEHPLNQFIEARIIELPPPYEYRNGIRFTWKNYNQDIKGFVKKKVTGLKASREFEVNFSVDILTYMSEECLGIGGSPGTDVTIKVNILSKEPIIYIDESGAFPIYRLDIDDPLYGGAGTHYLGNIGLPFVCDDLFLSQEKVWEVKTLSNDQIVNFTSNEAGEGWVYLSIDSGVGNTSEVYLLDYILTVNEL